MAIVPQVFPETLFFNVLIDGNAFPYTISGKMQHGINAARSVTLSFAGREALEMCRLGAVVEINWGRGNLDNLVDDKTFLGIIKDIKPRGDVSTFTALDYTTFLAESQYVYYEAQDYIGTDLYYAAASACNYNGIDVSRLVQGTGIPVTSKMNLFGWKTRKEFIDACFDEMKVVVNDDRHPVNTIRQWQYAIRDGKAMDFFFPDPDSAVSHPYVTLSEANGNVLSEDVISSIDTTRLVNAITVASSSNEKLYAQVDNLGSQSSYGVVSKFISYKSEDENELESVAYQVLNKFKEPNISYTLSISNKDNLDLGDLVRIDLPSLPKETVKTIIGYEVTFGESIATRYVVGKPRVSIKEYIDLLKTPTDR